VVEAHEGEDARARADLVQLVLVVHRYLAHCDLSAREWVDVRHDLMFLISESHRHALRRYVAAQVCASVVWDVSMALPDRDSETMLRSASAHLGWVLAAGREDAPEWSEQLISLLRGDKGSALLEADVSADTLAQPAEGLLPRPRARKGR
jgi:hypothetical protein